MDSAAGTRAVCFDYVCGFAQSFPAGRVAPADIVTKRFADVTAGADVSTGDDISTAIRTSEKEDDE